MALVIETKKVKRMGHFECWAVFINGCQVGGKERVYLSEAKATEVKKRYILAWNIEKIGRGAA